MKATHLIYDFFTIILCIGLGLYLLLYFHGKIKLSEKKERNRKDRIQKYGGIIKICIAITLIGTIFLFVIFIVNILKYLQ